MDFDAMAQRCAPLVAPATARALVEVESGFDPLAMHVNGGRLERQPRNMREAVATAVALRAAGWDFDLGLAQINVRNVDRFGMPLAQVFDPCANLRLMQRILMDCVMRAVQQRGRVEQIALRDALSCYNTGNFREGFGRGYVGRIIRAARSAMKKR